MTVANQTNRTSAVGSGAVGQVVPFTFPISATSDLTVKKRVTATGVETTLAETTNYTVSITRDTGGTLTTVTAIEATETIHIVRNTPMTQSLDLEQGGSFNAENIEDALDKNTKLIIENSDACDRTLTFPDTDPASSFADMPNSIDRASKNLSFDSDGKPTASTVVETGEVTFTDFGTTIAEAADVATALGLLGLDTDDDVEFAGITGSTGTFTDIVTKGPLVDIRAYGAVGDGTTDDTVAIQAAIDAGGTVFIPATDNYYKTTTVLKVPSDVKIIGTGEKSFIRNTATSAPAGWGGAAVFWSNVFTAGNWGAETRPIARRTQPGAAPEVSRRTLRTSTSISMGAWLVEALVFIPHLASVSRRALRSASPRTPPRSDRVRNRASF